MLPALEKLLRLQDRDQRIAETQSALASIPKELAAREADLAALRKALDSKKARSREIETERKTLENEVLSHRERISRYKTQQLQTRKNEEYAALAHEIDAVEKQITSIEDREIELMEEMEALAPSLKEADAAFHEGVQKNSAQVAAIGQKRGNLGAQLDSLQTTRPALLEGIDEDLLDLYTRLFKAKNGAAVVALEQGICTGCHMSVPQQTVVETRSGRQIVQCPQCGRILFHPS